MDQGEKLQVVADGRETDRRKAVEGGPTRRAQRSGWWWAGMIPADPCVPLTSDDGVHSSPLPTHESGRQCSFKENESHKEAHGNMV